LGDGAVIDGGKGGQAGQMFGMQALIEIDNRGQHLKSCASCNVWLSMSGKRVELSVADLHAIQELRRMK